MLYYFLLQLNEPEIWNSMPIRDTNLTHLDIHLKLPAQFIHNFILHSKYLTSLHLSGLLLLSVNSLNRLFN